MRGVREGESGERGGDMLDTSITDAEFEDELMERWRSRSRARRTCETCAHYGCCADLPNCGGKYWKEAEDGE